MSRDLYIQPFLDLIECVRVYNYTNSIMNTERHGQVWDDAQPKCQSVFVFQKICRSLIMNMSWSFLLFVSGAQSEKLFQFQGFANTETGNEMLLNNERALTW